MSVPGQVYEYGPPATESGPCLITYSYDSLASTSITYMVQLCNAGSISYDNPIDNISEDCSYLLTDTIQDFQQTCRFTPLSGQLSGSGETRKLSDASSTVILTVTTIPVGTDSAIFLGVDNTALLEHFLTDGAAGATTDTGAGLTTARSSTATKSSSAQTTSSLKAGATSSSATSSSATSTKTTSQASISSTSSGAAAAATTSAKNSQNRLRSSNTKTLVLIGSLVLAMYIM